MNTQVKINTYGNTEWIHQDYKLEFYCNQIDFSYRNKVYKSFLYEKSALTYWNKLLSNLNNPNKE